MRAKPMPIWINRIFPALLTAFLMLSVAPVGASDPTEVGWDDLVPELDPYDDPFEALTPEQLYLLADYAQYQQLQIDGVELSEAALTEMENAKLELEDQGVDIEGLLAMREEVTQKRMQQAYAINPDLDGENIRIPGYMLPLEFRDRDVIEFLLVPYVGACIHVPPPPPNQIVYVTLEEGYPTTDLFTPVWIEGEMIAEKTEQNLTLVDGSDNIPVSYTINAKNVELYE